ncbi:hypothetical protein BQ8794_80151 [Mesorhizobium prunaredense]|uniref:Uncharacterized protein n=1 Tax=Mesorhizobium prunaredense TaxID=1631249 RepID=A0A1R3VIS9_9HYPH|nr:hypothetical protein BQ8794_80151 [Mesorhizobium prunaredense]
MLRALGPQHLSQPSGRFWDVIDAAYRNHQSLEGRWRPATTVGLRTMGGPPLQMAAGGASSTADPGAVGLSAAVLAGRVFHQL